MLDVLSLTLDDQVVAFVQVDQLLDQLLPGRLLLLARLGLPGLRQSFPDRAVQLDPPLYLRNILEHIELNVDLQRSPGARSCAQRRKFSSVEQLQKKAGSPLHNAGVSCVGNDDHLVIRVHVL